LRKRLLKRCNVKIDKRSLFSFKRSNLRNKFDRAIEKYSKDFEFIQKQMNIQKIKKTTDNNSQDEGNSDYEISNLENTINEFRHRIYSTELAPDLLLNAKKAENRTPWYEILYDLIKSKLNLKSENINVEYGNQMQFKIFNRVSRIDRVARIFYPVSFALFNLIYWRYYLVERDNHQDDMIKLT
jgi:hypothetical protein